METFRTDEYSTVSQKSWSDKQSSASRFKDKTTDSALSQSEAYTQTDTKSSPFDPRVSADETKMEQHKIKTDVVSRMRKRAGSKKSVDTKPSGTQTLPEEILRDDIASRKSKSVVKQKDATQIKRSEADSLQRKRMIKDEPRVSSASPKKESIVPPYSYFPYGENSMKYTKRNIQKLSSHGKIGRKKKSLQESPQFHDISQIGVIPQNYKHKIKGL